MNWDFIWSLIWAKQKQNMNHKSYLKPPILFVLATFHRIPIFQSFPAIAWDGVDNREDIYITNPRSIVNSMQNVPHYGHFQFTLYDKHHCNGLPVSLISTADIFQ